MAVSHCLDSRSLIYGSRRKRFARQRDAELRRGEQRHTAMTYGNGKSTTIGHDYRARAETVTSSGVLGLTYGYDGADNVKSFDNTAVANSSRTMTYDKLDRILTSVAPNQWGSTAYDYDELGNRTLKSRTVHRRIG